MGTPAKLVLLNDAVSKGAVCLDGSPPGYYLRPGIGSGQEKLIIHMEGGGWCYDEDACVARSKTPLGSSKHWSPTATFDGFLSDDPQHNPLFFNWTMVFLMYCDGASFTGNMNNVVIWKGTDLYFRGFRILQFAMQSIKSLSDFSEVILTGCSAGGLATYVHADYISSIFAGMEFNAFSDAGFILDAPNVDGKMYIQGVVRYVYKMQNCTGGLNQDCVRAYSPQGEEWRCFFAQYSEVYIKSRLFGLNSQFDTWQLANVLELNCLPPNCSDDQMKLLENYGKEFREASADFGAHKDRGYFVDSCLEHCQSLNLHSWTSIKIDNVGANETFADWYYGTGSGRAMDCPTYPCNDTC